MGGLATLGIVVVGFATDQAEIARFRGDLAKLRTEFRTIHIEFKLTRKNLGEQEYAGKLLMLRDKDRTLYGLLEIGPTTEPATKETWVLRGEDIYELQHSTRTIVKHHSAKEGAFEYVADVFPGVWLLDAKEAEKRCAIRVMKRNENYKYFAVKVGKPATEYRFAVMARDVGGFPRGAIRQVAVIHPDGTQEFWKITKWSIDADAKLSATDFSDPAKMEGWKTAEWPGWKSFFEQLRKTFECHADRSTRAAR